MPKKTEKQSPLEKLSRCQKGTVRDKKTRLCVAKTNVETIAKKKSPKNKTQKAAKILEKRRECIQKWRLQHTI